MPADKKILRIKGFEDSSVLRFMQDNLFFLFDEVSGAELKRSQDRKIGNFKELLELAEKNKEFKHFESEEFFLKRDDYVLGSYCVDYFESSEGYECPLDHLGLYVLLNQICDLLRNPKKVASCLKSLESELAKEMQGVGFEVFEPEFLIEGRDHFVPGAAPKGYAPWKKGRVLEKILLARQKEFGANVEGYSAKFAGVVDKEKAGEFIKDGHIFQEVSQIGRFLLHGSKTHALAFEIISQAFKKKMFDCCDKIEMRDLFKIITNVVVVRDYGVGKRVLVQEPFWDAVIDNARDTASAFKTHYLHYPSDLGLNLRGLQEKHKLSSYDHYSNSSVSPFVLNSLLLCLGGDMDLPYLQSYLLDSHYKQVARTAADLRQKDWEFQAESFDELYTALMFNIASAPRFAMLSFDPGYALLPKTFRAPDKYQEYEDSVGEKVGGIIFKEPKDEERVFRYESFEDYMMGYCELRGAESEVFDSSSPKPEAQGAKADILDALTADFLKIK